MGKERKTISAEEIRTQLHLSKQAMANYLSLGVLTPVPGTEDYDAPLFYADEIATIRTAMTSCERSIKRLNLIRSKVIDEIQKANAAIGMLKLNTETKDGIANEIIDSISLFIEKSINYQSEYSCPLRLLYNGNEDNIQNLIKSMSNGSRRNTPQDFCNGLYHEIKIKDATSLSHCLEERDALLKERDDLKKDVEKLKNKIKLLSSEAQEYLASNGYCKELTEKQSNGLNIDIIDCGFPLRILNCLCAYTQIPESGKRKLADIVPLSLSTVKRFRNLGSDSINLIIEKLAEYDLTFGMDIIEINGKYYYKDI